MKGKRCVLFFAPQARIRRHFGSKYISWIHIPKGIEIIHVFKRSIHVSQTRAVFFKRPPDWKRYGGVISVHWMCHMNDFIVFLLPCVPLKHRCEHRKKVLFAFGLGRNRIVKCWIHAVKRSALHRIWQDLYCCNQTTWSFRKHHTRAYKRS